MKFKIINKKHPTYKVFEIVYYTKGQYNYEKHIIFKIVFYRKRSKYINGIRYISIFNLITFFRDIYKTSFKFIFFKIKFEKPFMVYDNTKKEFIENNERKDKAFIESTFHKDFDKIDLDFTETELTYIPIKHLKSNKWKNYV